MPAAHLAQVPLALPRPERYALWQEGAKGRARQQGVQRQTVHAARDRLYTDLMRPGTQAGSEDGLARRSTRARVWPRVRALFMRQTRVFQPVSVSVWGFKR